jgi:hypothetical protein
METWLIAANGHILMGNSADAALSEIGIVTLYIRPELSAEEI